MIEKERRFIYNTDIPFELQNNHSVIKMRIVQGYLFTDDKGGYLRIRNTRFGKEQHTNLSELCIKKVIDKTTRNEIEFDIPLKKYNELYELLDKIVIKDRTEIYMRKEGLLYVLDTFLDKEDKVLAQYIEIETKTGTFPEHLPAFCGGEVSGDPKHSNFNYLIDK